MKGCIMEKLDYHNFYLVYHVRIQRRGVGVWTPLKNNKNIGFPSNIGPDPLKITKLPSQHSMLGHHRPGSQMPFFLPKWILPPTHQLKKNVFKVGPPLTKLSRSTTHVYELYVIVLWTYAKKKMNHQVVCVRFWY